MSGSRVRFRILFYFISKFRIYINTLYLNSENVRGIIDWMVVMKYAFFRVEKNVEAIFFNSVIVTLSYGFGLVTRIGLTRGTEPSTRVHVPRIEHYKKNPTHPP